MMVPTSLATAPVRIALDVPNGPDPSVALPFKVQSVGDVVQPAIDVPQRPEEHVVEQLPQWFGSVLRSTHSLLHIVSPHAHESVCSSTQAPLQSVYPLLHATVHAPSMHSAVAFAMDVEHAVPHAPASSPPPLLPPELFPLAS